MEKTEPISYTVKTITFMKRRVPIMMQNQNGPCPLLALANILLLRNQIQLSPDAPSITQDRLIALVAGHLLDANNSDRLAAMDDDYRANMQQNIADAIAQLSKLATGIDVNVSFSSIRGFEFTQETVIFDLLDVRLLHGWLVDPQDTETAAYIGDHSYNELVSLMVDRLGNEATTGPGSFPGTQATEPEPSPEPHSAERPAASEGEMQSSSARPFIPNSSDADTRQMEGQAPAVGTSEDVSSLSQSIQGIRLNEEDADLERALALSLTETSFLPEDPRQQPATSVIPLPDEGRAQQHHMPPACDMASQHCTESSAGSHAAPQSQGTEDDTISCSSGHHPKDRSTQIGGTGRSEVSAEAAECDLDRPSDSPAGGSGLSSHAQEQAEILAQDQPSSSGTNQELSGPQRRGPATELQPHTAGALAKGKGSAPRNSPQDFAQSRDIDVENEEMPSRSEDASARRAEEMHQAMLVQSFFQRTSSQLTEHGLRQLHTGMRSNELGILFRNNHFNVIFAYNGAVWVLATDQGYLFEEVVWERLNDVHGNNEFVRADFSSPGDRQSGDNATLQGAKPNADADLALALQMQEEENERQVRFLASQKKANDSSYLQAAAKAPRDVPERQTQSPSAAAGKQAMPGKQNRPSSDKSGAWKFWKW